MPEDIQFAEYADGNSIYRQDYPPLPRKGGNPNAQLNQGAEMGVLSALQAYQRKKGIAPVDLTSQVQPEPELPDDPEVQQMRAAGWV